jgi:tetratricopeptide (TPR) repeat protein
MKKSTALAFVILFVKVAIAQNSAVTNAMFHYSAGELLKAKEEIDKAAVHEKTSKSAKMWYNKGVIYMDLASSPKPEFNNAVPDGLKVAREAFQKVKEFDKPEGEYVKLSKDKMYPLWVHVINKGFALKDSSTSAAYEYYEIAQQLLPDSAAGYEYAIDLALRKENTEKLKVYYPKLLSLKKHPDTYYNYSWVLQNKDKNFEKALEVVQQGRKEFPSNVKLMEDEISIYTQLKRVDEAQSKIEQALQADPKNSLLHFQLGTIYSKKGEDAKSLEHYNKALEINPESFETNFNLGAVYYNKGANLLTLTNKMSLTEYQKTGQKKEEEALAYIKQSLPFLEKAHALNRKDQDVRKILKDIYVRLKMEDKLNGIK